VTDLHRQMAGCFVALDWFGRVSEFNRMRALRTGRTLPAARTQPPTAKH
jgi:hypothetical protein